jgi:plastocyanin
MSDETLFFVFGAVLVAAALVVSFGGLRATSFPPSRAVLIGATTLFAGLVLATTAFALLNARDEQEHRRAELAAEEEEAAAEEGQPEAGGGTTLDLTSPEDGSLVFEPDGLEAAAGEVTIVYENPSEVGHNIALEFEGEELVVSDTITNGSAEISQTLEPGEYVFYCDVPGHRDAGMLGDLTVTGPGS